MDAGRQEREVLTDEERLISFWGLGKQIPFSLSKLQYSVPSRGGGRARGDRVLFELPRFWFDRLGANHQKFRARRRRRRAGGHGGRRRMLSFRLRPDRAYPQAISNSMRGEAEAFRKSMPISVASGWIDLYTQHIHTQQSTYCPTVGYSIPQNPLEHALSKTINRMKEVKKGFVLNYSKAVGRRPHRLSQLPSARCRARPSSEVHASPHVHV